MRRTPKREQQRVKVLNQSGFSVSGVNAELTLSAGADGLVEKPKRSFTDVLGGFCAKEFKQMCLSTPHAGLDRYM